MFLKKSNKFYILSYPRSGNHLLRYLIELYSGYCTSDGSYDFKSLYIKKYAKKSLTYIINDDFPKHKQIIGVKRHNFKSNDKKDYKLIFLIRNINYAIFSQLLTDNFKKDLKEKKEEALIELNQELNLYGTLLKEYNNWKFDKFLIKYEDLTICNEKNLIDLFDFVKVNKNLSSETIFKNYHNYQNETKKIYYENVRVSNYKKTIELFEQYPFLNNYVSQYVLENYNQKEIKLLNNLYQ